MERKAFSGIMLTLLLASISALAFNARHAKAEPRTWTVDDDGPADYHLIQEAINIASEGDTVSVCSGIYHENIIVNKTVSLVGINRTTTIIHSNSAWDAWGIAIEADWANITGFSITSGDSAIFFPRSVSHIGITNCNIYNNDKGLYSHELCSHINVIGCNIFNQRFGVILLGSSHVIEGCNIFSNDEGIGLNTPTNNCVIAHSSLWNNEHGISVGVSSSHVIENSYIFNNTVGISFVGNGIDPVTHHIVTNCEISRNTYGLYLSSTLNSHINVTNCDISNNELGVKIMSYSYNNSIYHNNFINNTAQAVDGSTNLWNDIYPSSGNYWTDYTGLDLYKGPYQNETGGDGIGDTSYPIDGHNKDRYPLMDPRPLPELQKADYEFYELLADYKKLESTYESLQSGYYNLDALYEDLLANYTSSQTELNDLQSKYGSLKNELDSTRNMLYISVATALVFTAATVYLATRKSMAKTELRTA